MINFYFKIKHKINYTEKTVCIVDSSLFNARKGLNQCYPNWTEIQVNFKLPSFEQPTEKQLNYIASIEENSGVKFNGQTKQEASEYIQKNKGKRREMVPGDIYCFDPYWDLD